MLNGLQLVVEAEPVTKLRQWSSIKNAGKLIAVSISFSAPRICQSKHRLVVQVSDQHGSNRTCFQPQPSNRMNSYAGAARVTRLHSIRYIRCESASLDSCPAGSRSENFPLVAAPYPRRTILSDHMTNTHSAVYMMFMQRLFISLTRLAETRPRFQCSSGHA